jgi:hypothetical protein
VSLLNNHSLTIAYLFVEWPVAVAVDKWSVLKQVIRFSVSIEV